MVPSPRKVVRRRACCAAGRSARRPRGARRRACRAETLARARRRRCRRTPRTSRRSAPWPRRSPSGRASGDRAPRRSPVPASFRISRSRVSLAAGLARCRLRSVMSLTTAVEAAHGFAIFGERRTRRRGLRCRGPFRGRSGISGFESRTAPRRGLEPCAAAGTRMPLSPRTSRMCRPSIPSMGCSNHFPYCRLTMRECSSASIVADRERRPRSAIGPKLTLAFAPAPLRAPESSSSARWRACRMLLRVLQRDRAQQRSSSSSVDHSSASQDLRGQLRCRAITRADLREGCLAGRRACRR